MNALKESILSAAKAEGIDLIGFASKERFSGIEAKHNPFSVFPEGKTVIMVGKRICRGSLRGVEEGTNFSDYALFGKNWLEDEFLSLACYNLVNVIEDNGWEAVPLFDNPPEAQPSGVAVSTDRPAPNVFPDFTYAAVACGLCEIGYSGLPLSPKLGARQRFQMIITDAELTPSPILKQSICDDCQKCVQACPYGAISPTQTKTVTICGKEMHIAEVNYEICKQCKNGAIPNRFTPAGKPDRVAALCNRTCMCHLEEEKLVENTFQNPFRKREHWAIGTSGSIYERNTEASNVLGGEFSKSGNRGERK